MPLAFFTVLIDLNDHERDVRLVVSVDVQLQHREISAYKLLFQQVASCGKLHDLSVLDDAEIDSPLLVQEISFRGLCLDCIVGSVWQIVCSRLTDTAVIGSQRYDQGSLGIHCAVNEDIRIAVAVD